MIHFSFLIEINELCFIVFLEDFLSKTYAQATATAEKYEKIVRKM